MDRLPTSITITLKTCDKVVAEYMLTDVTGNRWYGYGDKGWLHWVNTEDLEEEV